MWRGVFAIIYTYNRKELVAQCLASVLAQSEPPEHIILVDNGCTDGTAEHLRAQGLLEDPRIDYVRLERNVGAAGGMRAGITRAFVRGGEWVWVMDDDVVCQPETLARLREAYESNFSDASNLGFLASRLIGPDGSVNNVPHIDDRRDLVGNATDWSHLLHRGLVRLRIATLTSALIPRSTLALFGVPRSDFFIWGEDTDYTLRVTSRLPGYLVGASVAVHLRDVPGDLDILTETEPQRVRNFYYLYRNTLYLRRTYWPPLGFYLFLGKAVLQFCRAFGSRTQRLRRAWTILSGTAAGLVFRPRDDLFPAVAGSPASQSTADHGGKVAVSGPLASSP